jgi:putative toxin-antitoxin system antitoxin component (TIGR02293 family)
MIREYSTTTAHYQELINALGKHNVKEKIESPFDFIQLASIGVSASMIGSFLNYFKLSKEATAHMLNISSATLYRWMKTNKTLERNDSIKLFEIADLFLYGIEIFEDRDNFFKWLELPNTTLGGMKPQELIEIPGGVDKVRNILGRIEYGVYS